MVWNYVALAVQAASTLYTSSRAKKASEEAEVEANARDVKRPGESDDLELVYGRAAVRGIPSNVAGPNPRFSSSGNTRSPTNGRKVFRGQQESGFERGSYNRAGYQISDSRGGENAEHLAVQYAFSNGPAESMDWLRVDGRDHDAFELSYGQRLQAYPRGGPDTMGSVNGLSPTYRYADTALVGGMFRLGSPVQYRRGIPELTAYGRWGRIHTVDKTGNVHSLSATRIYSNNPVYVVLDLLMDTDYGWSVPVEMLDLKTFFDAAQLCDKPMDTLPGSANLSFPRRGAVWRLAGNPSNDPSLPGFRAPSMPDVPFLKWDFLHGRTSSRVQFNVRNHGGTLNRPTTGKARFQAIGAEWEFDWSAVRGSGEAQNHNIALSSIREVGGSRTGTSLTRTSVGHGNTSVYPAFDSGPTARGEARLKLAEFNGRLPATMTLSEKIKSAMSVIPNARLILSGGTIKFAMSYPTTQAEQDDLVIGNYTDDDLLDRVRRTTPDPKTRYRRYKVAFLDEANDFDRTTVVWPLPGSPEEAAIAQRVAPRVGDGEVFLEGVSTKTHAIAICEQEVRTGLRGGIYTLVLPISEGGLEPGDLVTAESTLSSLAKTVMQVDTVSVDNENGTATLTCNAFDYRDLALNLNQPLLDPVAQSAAGLLSVPPLATLTVASVAGVIRRDTLTWTYDGESTGDILELQVSDDAIDLGNDNAGWTNLATLENDPERTKWSYTVPDPQNTHRYRARQVADHGYSEWIYSGDVEGVGLLDEPPPPTDECFRYDNLGGIITQTSGGVYNWTNPEAFAVASASDLDFFYKRYGADDEIEEPAPSATIPSDVYRSVSDVPAGTGDIYFFVGNFENGMWQFGNADDIKPKLHTAPTGGRMDIVFKVFRIGVSQRAPNGGSYDGTTLTPPEGWTTAFPTAAAGETVYASIIMRRLRSGETWTQTNGEGRWHTRTLKGDWSNIKTKGHTLRVDHMDADGVDRSEAWGRLVPGSVLVYKHGARNITFNVRSHLPFPPDNPRGEWVNLDLAAKQDGGDESPVPLADGTDVSFCLGYGIEEEGEDEVFKDNVDKSADVLDANDDVPPPPTNISLPYDDLSTVKPVPGAVLPPDAPADATPPPPVDLSELDRQYSLHGYSGSLYFIEKATQALWRVNDNDTLASAPLGQPGFGSGFAFLGSSSSAMYALWGEGTISSIDTTTAAKTDIGMVAEALRGPGAVGIGGRKAQKLVGFHVETGGSYFVLVQEIEPDPPFEHVQYGVYGSAPTITTKLYKGADVTSPGSETIVGTPQVSRFDGFGSSLGQFWSAAYLHKHGGVLYTTQRRSEDVVLRGGARWLATVSETDASVTRLRSFSSGIIGLATAPAGMGSSTSTTPQLASIVRTAGPDRLVEIALSPVSLNVVGDFSHASTVMVPPPAPEEVEQGTERDKGTGGGYNFVDPTAFTVSAAGHLDFFFRRFALDEEVAAPAPSATIPADMHRDVADVRAPNASGDGEIYRMIGHFDGTMWNFGQGDDVAPRAFAPTPDGFTDRIHKVFRLSTTDVKGPDGGSTAADGSFTPPQSWSTTFPADVPEGSSAYASIIFVRSEDDAEWTQSDSIGRWQTRTIGGDWKGLKERANIVRVEYSDAGGTFRRDEWTELTGGSFLVFAQGRRNIAYKVVSTLPIGPEEEPYGQLINIDFHSKEDMGDETDVPIGKGANVEFRMSYVEEDCGCVDKMEPPMQALNDPVDGYVLQWNDAKGGAEWVQRFDVALTCPE